MTSLASDRTAPATSAHALSGAEVARRLGVDAGSGLPPSEVAARATAAGPNAVAQVESPRLWRMVVASAAQPFVLLLFAAGVGAILLGEARDGWLVLAGLILHSFLT